MNLGVTPIGSWAERYLATVVNLRASTRYTYERDLSKYVLPRFARAQLAQVRGVDVQTWLADELANVSRRARSTATIGRCAGYWRWRCRISSSPSTRAIG